MELRLISGKIQPPCSLEMEMRWQSLGGKRAVELLMLSFFIWRCCSWCLQAPFSPTPFPIWQTDYLVLRGLCLGSLMANDEVKGV